MSEDSVAKKIADIEALIADSHFVNRTPAEQSALNFLLKRERRLRKALMVTIAALEAFQQWERRQSMFLGSLIDHELTDLISVNLQIAGRTLEDSD